MTGGGGGGGGRSKWQHFAMLISRNLNSHWSIISTLPWNFGNNHSNSSTPKLRIVRRGGETNDNAPPVG